MSTASLRHCLKSGPDRRTELQDPVLRRGREGEDHDEERKANPDLMPEFSLSGLRFHESRQGLQAQPVINAVHSHCRSYLAATP